MSHQLVHYSRRTPWGAFAFRVQLSDCWTEEGRTIRWQIANIQAPDHPEARGLRLILWWFAIWIARIP